MVTLTPLGMAVVLAAPLVAVLEVWFAGAGRLAAAILYYAVAVAIADAIVARLLFGRAVSVQRRLPAAALSVNAWHCVELVIVNRSRVPLDVVVFDDPPELVQWRGLPRRPRVPARGRAAVSYSIRPRRRGKLQFNRVYLRIRGALGLSRFQLVLSQPDSARAMPEVGELVRYDLLARMRRLRELGLRPVRMRGTGLEFESLREYLPDDDFRQIDWKATARRGRVMTRVYQAERNQNVIFAFDCGRMMAGEAGGVSKLDGAIVAAVALARVAATMGDAVGWLAFADRILSFSPPRSGQGQVRRMAEALCEVELRLLEPDYRLAFSPLRGRAGRRSLLIVFTDIVDVEASQRLLACVSALRSRHLPLLVAVRDPTLDALAGRPPADALEAFRCAVAVGLVERRELALASLARRGVLVLDARPDQITAPLINEYLRIKAAGLL